MSLILGIDIGTTTVKVCVVQENDGVVLETQSRETKATVPSDLGPLGSEQEPAKICTALQWCVSRLSKEMLSRVARIGISGQMHGCVLWKQDEAWKQNQFGRYEVCTDFVSLLYTWQDRRCTPEFLDGLPRPESHLRVSAGYGCPTIVWLQRNKPDMLEKYDRAGTVQDFVVAMICGLEKPVMSNQNAAGWGYFNTVDGKWNMERLQEIGFPLALLPEVVPAGTPAGSTTCTWYGIPQSTPVWAAFGDMQCSVLSTVEEEDDAILNVSTSAQMSIVKEPGFTPPALDMASPLEYFPYFQGRYLAVAASLNGGNVMASFVKMLQMWTHELGLGVPESKIWERLLTLASDESSAETTIRVIPTLYGERHIPEQRASVVNIDNLSLGLGRVARGLYRGIIENLHVMMPKEFLEESGIKRIVGSGSALTKNPVLQRELERIYGLEVKYQGKGDAAVGAALAVLKYGCDVCIRTDQ